MGDTMYRPLTGHLAGNLRRLRQSRGLSQRRLAVAVGIRQATLSRLETGASLPDYQTLCALADVLTCSFDDLCAGDVGDTM